ncbi:acyltransferase [Synechococcus sp. CCY9201]|nr:acyltransferase [Synechococcus sp. CCY9201]
MAQRPDQVRGRQILKNDQRYRLSDTCFISPHAMLAPEFMAVGRGTYIASYCMARGQLFIGSDCSINAYCDLHGLVIVGDNVRIGSHSTLAGQNHRFSDFSIPIRGQGTIRRGIVIDEDVWIGSRVVVLDGVRIGSHSVIGAGSVVTKSIPSYSVAAGNPARVIRDRRTSRSQSINAKCQLKELLNLCENASTQTLSLKSRYSDQSGSNLFLDSPSTIPTLRAQCDAIELALMLNIHDTFFNHGQLSGISSLLLDRQQPSTGIYAELGIDSAAGRISLADQGDRYNILAAAYALELAGVTIKYPFSYVSDLENDKLEQLLGSLPWNANAWAAGGWIDMLSTSIKFNNKCFDFSADKMETIWSFLEYNINSNTGLWGNSSTTIPDLLQSVNGSYRILRGAYAFWGRPHPNPQLAIDTLLQYANVLPLDNILNLTACNALDVVYPLWYFSCQSNYRRAEICDLASFVLQRIIDNWIGSEGFSFSLIRISSFGIDHSGSLKGCEMWFSIALTCASILGFSHELEIHPKGIHAILKPYSST